MTNFFDIFRGGHTKSTPSHPPSPVCKYENDRNIIDILDIKPLGKCTYFQAGNRLKVKEEGNGFFFFLIMDGFHHVVKRLRGYSNFRLYFISIQSF
jgi:hypothetical protein